MKVWLFVGSVLLLYSIETTVFMPISMWGVRPDLVLVFLCAVSLSRGWKVGSVAGFIAGFLVDLMEGHLIGLGAISKAMAGGAVGRIGSSLYGDNAFVPVLIVLGASLVEQSVYLFGIGAFGLDYPLVDGLARVLLPGMLYDAVAGAVTYPLFAAVVRRLIALTQDHGVGSSEA